MPMLKPESFTKIQEGNSKDRPWRLGFGDLVLITYPGEYANVS